MKDIEKYIKKQIYEISSIKISDHDYNKNLQDMGLDSMQFISLIVSLEEKYNFEFEDDMLVFSKMSSVNSIVKNIIKMKDISR
ncbi:TPA: acyl carrier protein [Streptococcus pyogenes]|uniref:acyl carrier protein n=1 Tax=Streptococcus pyogenes TaxID=1314 RepID=UPI00109BCD98|nr:acyl carrier protein [Streptococcus pyogenes]QCK61510.1 acyl carrier protein [Streptococcus pyogenes]VGQ66828.1 peptidase [Streptococcus pyogenes]VGT48817.1 peptidase [Streptococcus pyogenes]VGU74043.1 acyl carrier protein [Streptococcus pyogenes]VGV03879.1 acyl carrier protein [Streptococcus pyogenes]